MTIEEAQEECKRRFPIGCKYKSIAGDIFTLRLDNLTYSIHNDDIYAHLLEGSLYSRGVFAELISLPEDYVILNQPNSKKDDLKPLIKLLKELI